MNEKRPHVGRFDSPSGLFENVDKAKLAANTFKKKLERLCKKEKLNCIAIIVISQSKKNGTKRGRYGSYFLSQAKKTPAHLHITIVIDKLRSISDTILQYLEESFGAKFSYRPIKTKEHLQNRIAYSFQQRWTHRTVNMCSKEFIERYCGDFISISEKANKDTGDGKLVFKEYANLTLETDEILYDFNRSRKPKKDTENTTEVLTEFSANKEITNPIKDQEIEPFLPYNSQNHGNLDDYIPTKKTTDYMPLNCIVKYNKYNINNISTQYDDIYFEPF